MQRPCSLVSGIIINKNRSGFCPLATFGEVNTVTISWWYYQELRRKIGAELVLSGSMGAIVVVDVTSNVLQ